MVARLVVVVACLVAALPAGAAVVAAVDRERVELNESFTLSLHVDSDGNVAPDLTVLEPDFEIQQPPGQVSNTTIINGQIQRSHTWQISLMAKRAGSLTIPPITVGTEQSDPVAIEIREPSYEPPGEADVFITAEVDQQETFVQAQVLYTIKIFLAVATRQPALREPTFSGAEVLVEFAGDERRYSAVLNGREYDVVERAFAVFPQESGRIEISPARFEARVLRDGRITGRKIFDSESAHINVQTIPAAPPEFPNAAWLPAKDLSIADAWSREPDELRAGEPISRSITVSALGQLETQIPVMAPPEVDGVNIYPDKPTLSKQIGSTGIRGVRTDQYALIGVDAGEITLPELELPWWDIDAGEWKVARVPARRVNILPTEEMLLEAEQAAREAAEPPVEVATETATVQQSIVESSFWRRIAEILAALWLITLFGWWWSNRPHREEREAPPVPLHKQQARHLKAARQAAASGDAPAVRRALLEWGRIEWRDDSPRSIGELAGRVAAPLADELEKLSSASYGPNSGGFDGVSLAAALRQVRTTEQEQSRAGGESLPPLMPG
ncbi:MAG: BatD family protein [Woeseiaceae bacterium]